MLLHIVVVAAALIALTGIGVRLFNPLPPLEPRARSSALRESSDTPLGRGVSMALTDHTGLCGIRLLNNGPDAFAARVLLARAATRTLDLQYYIWNGDRSGTLMLEEMHKAADRGVRVRLLLDDNGIDGLDELLAALDNHPNIELRLFNPFVLRRPKVLGYLADFRRLNRRMHNKSFTADSQVTIIGGRNIGDEYFGASESGLFWDLDAIAIGAVVQDVSAAFDRYWASDSAFPASRILPRVGEERLPAITHAASIVTGEPATREYVEAVAALPIIREVLAGTLAFEWAKVRMVCDDPGKVLGRAIPEQRLMAALSNIIGSPTRQLALISGYFVPTAAGVEALAGIARSGIQVSIFTNSLEATDVKIVHAGYAHRRKALLEAGCHLYEMRGEEPKGDTSSTSQARTQTGRRSRLIAASSGSRLHAKTFSVDRERLFIGSFNLDPRSMRLNTELGFVIESPALAAQVQDAFDDLIPQHAYSVELVGKGKLTWTARVGTDVFRHTSEPGTTALQRGAILALSKLPIEWLL